MLISYNLLKESLAEENLLVRPAVDSKSKLHFLSAPALKRTGAKWTPVDRQFYVQFFSVTPIFFQVLYMAVAGGIFTLYKYPVNSIECFLH